MDIQRLQYLLSRYFRSRLTADEEKELSFFLIEQHNNAELKALMDEAWQLSQDGQGEVFTGQQTERMLARLMRDMPAGGVPPRAVPMGRPPVFQRWMWAAAVLVAVVAGTWVYTTLPESPASQATAVVKPAPIVPGQDGAILTLADGRQVVLDGLQDGTVASQAGAEVVLTKGMLLYQGEVTGAGEEGVMNTISTPNGRQFKLQLPDGTLVWLNAASSISYPVRFDAARRRVNVTGEAYFEVVTDATWPFVVEKDALSVVVTGTHFNIDTYDDELSARVTLLEGKVTVKNGSSEKRLLPGQQAEAHGAEQLQLHTSVNTEEIVAWKNGYFSFNNSDLQSVMRKLARWYNVEVVYEGEVSDMKFGGEIARSTALSQVLDILQESKVSFRIEHRDASVSSGRIIVSP